MPWVGIEPGSPVSQPKTLASCHMGGFILRVHFGGSVQTMPFWWNVGAIIRSTATPRCSTVKTIFLITFEQFNLKL